MRERFTASSLATRSTYTTSTVNSMHLLSARQRAGDGGREVAEHHNLIARSNRQRVVQVHSLTPDGETLFFETAEGLVRRDQNETKDVYRWKKGSG